MRGVRVLLVVLVATTGGLLLGLNLAPRQSHDPRPARVGAVQCRSLQGRSAKLQVHYIKGPDGATGTCVTGGTPCQQALALHLPRAVLAQALASAERTGLCARTAKPASG